MLGLTCAVAWSGPEAVQLDNAGFEAGRLDGWERAVPAALFEVTDEAAHSGRFCLRAHGDPEERYNGFAHLVQSVGVTPIPGARYEISGWVRGRIAPGKKSARLAVREVSAEDTTVCYDEVWLAPEPDRWQRVSHRFRARQGAVRFQVYVILSELAREDVVHLDDIEFAAVDAPGEPVTVAPPAFSGGGAAPERTREIAQDGLLAQIDRETGLMASLELTEPEPKLLHPPAADGTVVFAQLGDREVRFTRVLEGGPAEDAVMLGPEDGSLPLRARVRYDGDRRGITEHVTFEATGGIDQIVRLGVRHGFVVEDWERIICALRPVRVIEAGESTLFSYGERAGDLAPTKLDAWQSATFPMTVLQGADRWVCVGSCDLDDFVTLAPNQPAGYFPSVQQNPTGVREGDTFSFRITWRSFPKSEALLRDVWRWYAQNASSANPLIADLVPFEPHEMPRTLPPGCEVTASGIWAGEGARIDTARTIPGANIWYFGWHDWVNECYPAEGEWWCKVGGWAKENAEDLRRAIAQYQADGFKCYLYFRQIANLAQRGESLPEAWFLGDAGGALDLYGGGYTLDPPPEVAEETGYERIPWGMYDFGNDEFRAQYLAQVRACIDYYRPAGIAWDMGWRPRNPGILAVQAEVFGWLRRHHPEMRVIANEGGGSPSQCFADCVLIENGILYGKSVWDYEVSKGFGTQVASIERGHLFRRAAERILAGESGWPSAHGMADARRFAEWSMADRPLPDAEDAALEELTFRLHLRAGLRNMGLGANWAYVDGMRHYSTPMPDRLIDTMTELMAIPPLQQSFALRLSGGSDALDGLYAGGWADAQRVRLALFNDRGLQREAVLSVDREALGRHGWKGAPETVDCWMMDTSGELADWEATSERDGGALMLRAQVPPFSLVMIALGA